MIEYRCECGKSYQVGDDIAGRKVRCNECGKSGEVFGDAQAIDLGALERASVGAGKRHCRSCGKEVGPQAIACLSCGVSPVNGRSFCQHCGSTTLPEAQMCVKCGVRLVGSSQGKTQLIAGLLGVMLGGFGVHRFYLGYTAIGIIQIIVTVVTFGFGAIWGFVEGILILVGTYLQTEKDGTPIQPM